MLHEFVGSEVSDVILTGFADIDSDPCEFVPILDVVYIETDKGLMSIQFDDATARLNINFPDHVARRSDNGIGIHCFSSIAKYIINHTGAKNLISFFGIYDKQDGICVVSCKAFELSLSTGQLIFFDPLFFSGINFGGNSQRLLWINNVTEYTYKKIDDTTQQA